MVDYADRVIDRDLDEFLPDLPAILLDGPKGVGKTETAVRRAATVYRLDDPAVRRIVEADPNRVADGRSPILIDEWHLVPATWDVVKRAVDRNPVGGRFLLTGSPPSPSMSVHSGAGRIVNLRMRPMTLPERGVGTSTLSLGNMLADDARDAEMKGRSSVTLGSYTSEIVTSGFPGLASGGARARGARLDGYIELIVGRDLPEAGVHVRRPDTLRAWLRAYAAASGTTASWEAIRDAATPGHDSKPAKSTTVNYVDALNDLRVLDDLPAWEPGHGHLSRLGRSPKHHLVDPALAARLVGVGPEQLLEGRSGAVSVPRDGTFLGGLFESLVAMSVRVFAQSSDSRVAHLRDRDGHEVDIIVERADGRVLAIEVKLGSTVDDRDVRHLRWLRARIGDRMLGGVVINTGPGAYRRPDGIAVVPLALLGP